MCHLDLAMCTYITVLFGPLNQATLTPLPFTLLRNANKTGDTSFMFKSYLSDNQKEYSYLGQDVIRRIFKVLQSAL